MNQMCRKVFRESLVGSKIKDIVFHDSHGLVIDLILEDNTKVELSSYDSHHDYPNKGELFVALNGVDFTYIETKNSNGWAK